MAKRLTNEVFATKGTEKYGIGAYDYSLVDYVNAKTKVKIICKVHGIFEQTPNSHLSMGGCASCGTEKAAAIICGSTESFTKSAQVLNSCNEFDYSLVNYIRAVIPVEIICNICKTVFKQTPNNHLNGAGCSCCAKTGYNSGKEASLYILQSGDVFKVGITNRTPEQRAKSVSKSSGKLFSVAANWRIYDGKDAQRVESVILKEFRKCYPMPTEKFDGYTECFIGGDIESFKERVLSAIYSSMKTYKKAA